MRRCRRPCRRKSAPRPTRPSPGAAGGPLEGPAPAVVPDASRRPPPLPLPLPLPPPLDLGAIGTPMASFSPPPAAPRGRPAASVGDPTPGPLRRRGPPRGVRAWAWTWPSWPGRRGDGRPDPGGRAGAAHGAAAAARAAAADAADGRAGRDAPRPARPDHGGGAAAERGDGGLPVGEPADVRDDGRSGGDAVGAGVGVAGLLASGDGSAGGAQGEGVGGGVEASGPPGAASRRGPLARAATPPRRPTPRLGAGPDAKETGGLTRRCAAG